MRRQAMRRTPPLPQLGKGLHVVRDSLAGPHLFSGYQLEYQALSGEVPKRSQRRRLEIGWSGNSGTWVRIPPSPPFSFLSLESLRFFATAEFRILIEPITSNLARFVPALRSP